MKRPLLVFVAVVCSVLAVACTNSGDGNTTTGTGGSGGGMGGVAGNNAGTGGAGGNVGTGGGAGSKGTGGSAGSKGTGGSAGSQGNGGSGGASQACGTANPCPGGKVCISYNCGPLGVLPGCTAPPPKCIDNPCDAGVCTSCAQSVCSPFGGNCYQADPSDIECIMPG